MENLWNKSIINKSELTPKEVLAVQANYLIEMTGGKLVGTIQTTSAFPYLNDDVNEFSSECFIHSFKISAPHLGYSFTLLRLVHETIKVKPYQVYSNLTEKKFTGNSIDDLEPILMEIINSKEVTNALSSLIAQSTTI